MHEMIDKILWNVVYDISRKLDDDYGDMFVAAFLVCPDGSLQVIDEPEGYNVEDFYRRDGTWKGPGQDGIALIYVESNRYDYLHNH